MNPPFVFITTHRIKPDRQEQFAALHAEYVRLVEADEPRILGHFSYLNEDGTEVSLVQIHPDAESADQHLELVAPRLASATDVVDNTAIEVYGAPGPAVQAALDRNRDAGVTVRITNQALSGFSRL